MKDLSIMIVGVGGQGTLLTSRILGKVAIQLGYDVKMSEVHGMAQRGGSVVTYVKMGNKVFSPIVDEKSADIILAFEELEALRWNRYLSENGTMIINKQKIDPMPVIIGREKYPDNINEDIKEAYPNTIFINAIDFARELGNVKVVNVIMLGKLAKEMKIEKDVFINSIIETVPNKFLEINKKAFEIGFNN